MKIFPTSNQEVYDLSKRYSCFERIDYIANWLQRVKSIIVVKYNPTSESVERDKKVVEFLKCLREHDTKAREKRIVAHGTGLDEVVGERVA